MRRSVVGQVFPDVSKGRIAFIFKVKQSTFFFNRLTQKVKETRSLQMSRIAFLQQYRVTSQATDLDFQQILTPCRNQYHSHRPGLYCLRGLVQIQLSFQKFQISASIFTAIVNLKLGVSNLLEMESGGFKSREKNSFYAAL